MGCDTPSKCYSDGGVDTALAQAICSHSCGITLPRTDGGRWYGLLDSCGGHTEDYHLHEKLSCLYTTAAGSGHSTKVGEGSDAAKTPLYGKWENYASGTLPLLDVCGGHFGVTPDSNGAEIYHNHVQDQPPFTFGCYGPSASGGLVTVAECRDIYKDVAVRGLDGSSGGVACDGVLKSYTTSTGTYSYDDWCPCFDGTTAGHNGAGSNTGVNIVERPAITGAGGGSSGGSGGGSNAGVVAGAVVGGVVGLCLLVGGIFFVMKRKRGAGQFSKPADVTIQQAEMPSNQAA